MVSVCTAFGNTKVLLCLTNANFSASIFAVINNTKTHSKIIYVAIKNVETLIDTAASAVTSYLATKTQNNLRISLLHKVVNFFHHPMCLVFLLNTLLKSQSWSV